MEIFKTNSLQNIWKTFHFLAQFFLGSPQKQRKKILITKNRMYELLYELPKELSLGNL